MVAQKACLKSLKNKDVTPFTQKVRHGRSKDMLPNTVTGYTEGRKCRVV